MVLNKKVMYMMMLTLTCSKVSLGMEVGERDAISPGASKHAMLANIGQAYRNLGTLLDEGEKHGYAYSYPYLDTLSQAEIAMAVLNQNDDKQRALFDYLVILMDEINSGGNNLAHFKDTDVKALVRTQREADESVQDHLKRLLRLNDGLIKDCLMSTPREFLGNVSCQKYKAILNNPYLQTPLRPDLEGLMIRFYSQENAIMDACLYIQYQTREQGLYAIFSLIEHDLNLLNEEGVGFVHSMMDSLLAFRARYMSGLSFDKADLKRDLKDLHEKSYHYFQLIKN